MRSNLALAILLVSTSACGARFSAADHTVRLGRLGFRVGELPAGWRRVVLGGERVAFHHERGGTISAGARCERYDDVPLEVLTDHLLFGFGGRTITAQAPLVLDGRAALRSRVAGTLDGVPIALDLVVLKKDGCLFDLQLVGAPAVTPARDEDFARFYRGFALLASR